MPELSDPRVVAPRAQPGVASVYCSIVQQTRHSVECYVRGFEALEGLSFAEARRRFDNAVIIGFLPPRGSAEALRMNPPEEEVLPKGARIIGLAHNGALRFLLPLRAPLLLAGPSALACIDCHASRLVKCVCSRYGALLQPQLPLLC